MGDERWANWSGSQLATPTTVLHPAGTDAIAGTITWAAGHGLRLKTIGAGHSFSAIGRPEEAQLVLDRHAGLVDLDPSTGLVTVQAGMSLHTLNRLLATAGLSLSNLGDIECQTVAGALSTGTHGTGARYGGLATQVRALELVLADGTVATCSPAAEPELFAAARVSLGALGVVSTVTLQAEPLFGLQAVEQALPLSEVLDGFDELADGTDHFEFFWFPHTQTTMTKRNTRLPSGASFEPPAAWRSWLEDELLANTAFGWAQAFAHRWPRSIPHLNRVTAWALSGRTYSDVSYRVFTSPRRVRFQEMEYAVPRAVAVEVLRELEKVIHSCGALISYPIEVRVAAADDIPLSTATGRETAYIAVHMDHRTPYGAYFRQVASIMDAAGGRPHWGKIHYLDAAALRSRYPLFEDFVVLRDALDPTGLFSNRYLDTVLGPPPQATERASPVLMPTATET